MPFLHLHRPGCGKPMFRIDHAPSPHEAISSKGVTHLNGAQAHPYEEIRCDSCGMLSDSHSLSLSNFVYEVDYFERHPEYAFINAVTSPSLPPLGSEPPQEEIDGSVSLMLEQSE